jgi:hypothetical protein
LTTRLLQGVLLKVEILLVRGDACVSDEQNALRAGLGECQFWSQGPARGAVEA